MINNHERRINRIKMQKFLGRRIRTGTPLNESVGYFREGGSKCVIGCILPGNVLNDPKLVELNSTVVEAKKFKDFLKRHCIQFESCLGYTEDELAILQDFHDTFEFEKCLKYLNSLPIEVK